MFLIQSLSSKVRLFVEDSILYCEVTFADDYQVLQNDLNKLTEWDEKWMMSFTPKQMRGTDVHPPGNNRSYLIRACLIKY